MTYPCAYCGSTASAADGCPSCGRGPDPDAIEVARADTEIAELNKRHAEARRAVLDIEAALAAVWGRRETAAARVRVRLAAAPATGAAAPAEASTSTVQNVLFLLGGLLLGIAALVFTAVAWAQFGVGGRAASLAVCTGAALAVPVLALRRGLTATAETFAAVGVLLLLLDGYAAWHVNLFGVATGSGWGYAGAVCAVTAAVAAGYEHVTGLSGPRFAALLVAQPVLPLLAAAADPGPVGWALTFAGVAALDVAVLAVRRGGLGLAAVLAGTAATVIAAGAALIGLFDPAASSAADVPAVLPAAGALLVAALVVVAGSVVSGHRVARAVAAGLLVVAVAVAAGRIVALLSPAAALLDTVAVAVVLAALVAVAPARLTRFAAVGPWVGALVVLAAPALVAAGTLAGAALLAGTPTGRGPGWPVPVALAVLAGGAAVPTRSGPRPAVLRAVALFAGLLAVPAAAWQATVALSAPAGVRVGVVLGAAGLVVAAAWLVLAGWPGESRAAEAAAHAGALVALGLAAGSAERAAAVCALWGLVLGVRAVRPAGRAGYLIAAAVAELAGWVLLLAGQRVTVLEAYTIPAAAVALLIGLLARRAGTGASSWTAYGPALAAALLPSLAAILTGDGQYPRRLLLGVAALAVVLAGAHARLQAPVVLGGGVLVLVGLHELAPVWDLVPRWIPLAGAGLLLVLLATTIERRRRDLDRVRAALHRMS